MKTVTESIFSGDTHIIPMADVHHIEKVGRDGYVGDINVIMNGTTWNNEFDFYNNSIYLTKIEASKFLKAWCRYRHELEFENISEIHSNELFDGTNESLNKLNIK